MKPCTFPKKTPELGKVMQNWGRLCKTGRGHELGKGAQITLIQQRQGESTEDEEGEIAVEGRVGAGPDAAKVPNV